jgi:H+-translocating NAD(P) transhydrogenase subunit beta
MNGGWQDTVAPVLYLGASVAFFLALKTVVKVRVASRGALYAAFGLVLALVGAAADVGGQLPVAVVAALTAGFPLGFLLGGRVNAAAPPARLAFVPALAGAAAAITAVGAAQHFAGSDSAVVALGLAALLGALAAIVGGVVALRGANTSGATAFAALTAVLAGWSVALLGFAVGSALLLVAGGVAGTAAVTFGRVAARASGRSLPAVLLQPKASNDSGYHNVRSCGTDEAAVVLENARQVVVIPGFGMSVAQAQHALGEVVAELEKHGTKVTFAIHPSAGRLPGHMNIALDEANIPHDKLIDLSAAEGVVAAADAVLVVGANDVVNTNAATDAQSPLYGLPLLDLGKARRVFVVKRSLRAGYAGVKNPLFENANTMMMFGDGKRVMQALVAELKNAGAH